MRYSLGILSKLFAAICGGWVVNQIPEIEKLPLVIPNYFLWIFGLIIFILLLILEQMINENMFREQTKFIRQANYSIWTSLLLSTALFSLSINTNQPIQFDMAMQYAALFIFVLGILFTIMRINRFVKENPEETHDALEESFLKAKLITEHSSQSVIRGMQEISGTTIFQDLLQGSIERQENLSAKIADLKSRFMYRNQAVKFLNEIVKNKKTSQEVSKLFFDNKFNFEDIDNSVLRNKQEKFRVQINFALKMVAISVKFARPNAFRKMLYQTPVFDHLLLKEDEYVYAFQLTYSKVEEIAIAEGLPLGAIEQIKRRFQDLIRIFENVLVIV